PGSDPRFLSPDCCSPSVQSPLRPRLLAIACGLAADLLQCIRKNLHPCPAGPIFPKENPVPEERLAPAPFARTRDWLREGASAEPEKGKPCACGRPGPRGCRDEEKG